MSCAEEHGDHHGHGHDHGDHHGHSHEVPLSAGPNDSLYGVVDTPNVVALNAMDGGEAGQRAIKPWHEKEDEGKYCESDADDSLIIKIPFNASVSLRSISIKAGPGGQTPSEMRLFKDAAGMDFSDAEAAEPAQMLEMVESTECVEYQVKAAKFAGITSLTLYFPGNTSDGEEDTTRVYYIGLRGKSAPLPQRPGIILYESAARPTDHKLEQKLMEGSSYRPGL
ncbi:galactose-binding domain-like protein [Kockovaella imperatae]|uniref:Galactose-binding domain-like protein n=1 Tax=Kockovaella imperatae TaxID=4999 RepID=A0A1Y1UIL8_9TREE|nr:galactose-binding domain-like protein [Kockovaella imperatae]ORX37900.1 galactose-binding domain-like protein [Kockovaella imperatae]